jgi:dethiobiotin synthetase
VRGVFVTGTDTGVGKTVVAAALCAALRASGERVAAYKPVLTGLDEAPDPVWPPDHALLAAVTGQAPEDVAPLRFGPPVSPHLAAASAGRTLGLPALAGGARDRAPADGALVVEGVGGLLVPFSAGATVRDLAVALALPIVVVARPGLGTINHTLLTLEAARAGGLRVPAVVITPWPEAPDAMVASNRETIAALGGVAVHGLHAVDRPIPGALATAAADLPVADWLAA